MTSGVQEPAQREHASGLRQVLLTVPEGTHGRVRCRQCQRLCSLPMGQFGYCRTKINLDGIVYDGIYGVVAAAAADPIEKKPVYHYRPGTRVFSVGAPSCNFRCRFCQNWDLSHAEPCQRGRWPAPNLTPEALVEAALTHGCQGVAWTYTEPSILADLHPRVCAPGPGRRPVHGVRDQRLRHAGAPGHDRALS